MCDFLLEANFRLGQFFLGQIFHFLAGFFLPAWVILFGEEAIGFKV
jgi:hypothetical protein